MNEPSLYVHVPFCSRKCLFCSFVIAVGQEHRRDDYVQSLLDEIKKYQGTSLKTIYLGGGTPSLLEEGQLALLMDGIRNYFKFTDDMEISIEANPETIHLLKAKFLKTQGFNRVSLGVQSMNDQNLKFLGRNHNVSRARDAFNMLRQAGFDNISLDLMYAFPGQTLQDVEDDVRAISILGSEHLSLYSLTIEPNSRFSTTQLKLDDDEKCAEQYVTVGRILHEYGFKQYEISNFSKPGFESAHNKNYWLGGPYIGLGVGAHGFTGRRRTWNVSNLQDYIKRAGCKDQVIGGFEDLTDEALLMEKILFGLRMNEGVSWELVARTQDFTLLQNRLELIQTWIKDGFLFLEGGNLKATSRGRLVLDELSARLI